jgi:hypothetical protein
MSKVMRIQSFDSLTHRVSRQTLDTLLSAATDEELAAYMAGRAKMNPGRVWDGFFKAALNAMDKATRDKILSSLDEYGNELATSEGEEETEEKGLTFGDNKEDEEEGRKGPSGESFTKDNIACNSKGGRTLRAWRDNSSDVVADMNKANAAFWKR